MLHSLTFLAWGLALATSADAAIDLGAAQSFGVFAATYITNTGATIIGGDLGIFPGYAVTGFPPGICSGTFHFSDAVAEQVLQDAGNAFNTAYTLTPTGDLTGQGLGGQTLGPGVYSFDSSAALTEVPTLDGQGNTNSQFVFQINADINTASVSLVLLINGDQACNVFWDVGGSATLGTGTSFAGTIVAIDSVSANPGATLQGGLFALNGGVTLDDDVITAQTACKIVVSSSSRSYSTATLSSTGTDSSLSPTSASDTVSLPSTVTDTSI